MNDSGTKKPTSTGRSKNSYRLLKYGCLSIGVLFLCVIIAGLGLFSYLHQTPSLPEPFPDYPNSASLDSITPWSRYESLNYANCGEALWGEKHKVFATTDSVQQVFDFYKKAAVKQKLILASDGYVPDGYGSTAQSRCYEPEKAFNLERPTNVIITLNLQDPVSAKVISQTFTNIPVDTKVIIILLQGYVSVI